MTVLVDKAYIDAGLRTARQLDDRLRKRFHETFGQEEGDRMVDTMVARMQENVRSDSKDPAEDMRREREMVALSCCPTSGAEPRPLQSPALFGVAESR